MRQATWGGDDTIVFQTHANRGLSRVSIQDGSVSPATRLGASERDNHFWPRFLEDGRRFLSPGRGGLAVGSLESEEPSRLVDGWQGFGTLGYTLGHVLYQQDGGLFARPFDERRLEFSGDPVRLLEEIPVSGPGQVPFSVSSNGVLVYWTHQGGEPREFRWIARDGTVSDPLTAPAEYSGWDLAADADRIVFSRFDDGGRRNIWLYDLARGDEQPITFGSPDIKVGRSPGRSDQELCDLGRNRLIHGFFWDLPEQYFLASVDGRLRRPRSG